LFLAILNDGFEKNHKKLAKNSKMHIATKVINIQPQAVAVSSISFAE
jgi:hypothetical protein